MQSKGRKEGAPSRDPGLTETEKEKPPKWETSHPPSKESFLAYFEEAVCMLLSTEYRCCELLKLFGENHFPADPSLTSMAAIGRGGHGFLGGL